MGWRELNIRPLPDASRFLQQSQTRAGGRSRQQNAPLFFQNNDPTEGDVNEEAQDIYALQSSRRFFGRPNTLQEDDEDGGQGSSRPGRGPNRLRSSWNAEASGGLDGSGTIGSDSEMQSASQLLGGGDSIQSDAPRKGGMMDIGLDESDRLGMNPEEIDYEDMVRDEELGRDSEHSHFHNDNPSADFAVEAEPEEYNPPSFHQFRSLHQNPYNDDPDEEDEYANLMPKPTPREIRQETPAIATAVSSCHPIRELPCTNFP